MVPLTHASVCLSAHNVGAALALTPRDRLLNVLPLFHGHGLISGVLAALAAGSSVVCTPGFDAAAFFRLANGVSTDLVHGGPGNPSGAVIGGTSPQARRSSVAPYDSSVRPLRPCRPTCSAGWKHYLAFL